MNPDAVAHAGTINAHAMKITSFATVVKTDTILDMLQILSRYARNGRKTMSDYISRQDILNLPQSIERNLRGEIVERSIDVKDVEALKPADVVRTVHGRWIEYEGEGYYGIHCSRCNFPIPYGNVMMGYNFCPNCGAKMDGGKS